MSEPIKLAYDLTEPSTDSHKPPIILMNGAAGRRKNFNFYSGDLAERTRRKVYTIDLRNHGESEWSDVIDLQTMAGDVIQFMDDHDINIAAFSGHSLGARLAMILALTHPERVEKIIVGDMTAKAIPKKTRDTQTKMMEIIYEAVGKIPGDVDEETASKMVMEYVMAHQPADAMKNVNYEALSKNPNALKIVLVKRNGKYCMNVNVSALLKSFDSLGLDKDLEGLCEKPALFIYGLRSDMNVGNHKDHILKIFPHAKFHGLDVSHLLHLESPEEFLKKVVEFINGTVTLAYSVCEPSDKSLASPIILIHGVGGKKEDFDNISSELAQLSHRKVYSVDLRNHGETEWNDESDLVTMVDDIIQFLDDHGISKAAFCGHSLGGKLSMLLAVTYPDRVDKLIIEDISPKALPKQIRANAKRLMALTQEAVDQIPSDVDEETATKMFMGYMMTHQPPESMKNVDFEALAKNPNVMKKIIIKRDGKYSPYANVNALIKLCDESVEEKNIEGLFSGPAFFVYGLKSEFNVLDDYDHIKKVFPEAKFHGIDASHLMHIERPEQFLPEVVLFLKD